MLPRTRLTGWFSINAHLTRSFGSRFLFPHEWNQKYFLFEAISSVNELSKGVFFKGAATFGPMTVSMSAIYPIQGQ